MRFLLAVLLTTAVSCSTIEDDRICIDWEEIDILEIALGIKQGAKKQREEIILD
jgi:hypothetical protein